MKTFLGIDGGGTHSRAVLVDETGLVLGTGMAGASNYHNVGLVAATENLRLAAQAAFRQAGRSVLCANGAFLGLAGVKSPSDIARMKAAAESIGLAPAESITVVNDLHNALAGGLNGAPGIALIAGTGSNSLGRDASGKTFMCGGWGWLLDDRGAGFGLGAEGFRAATRAADRRARATRLLPATLEFLGLSEPDALLERLYAKQWDPRVVAGFAPVVVRLAAEGDATAQAVLVEGAAALAELIATIARELDFPEGPDVVLLGGCVRSGPPYQPLVEQAVRKACPQARLRDPAYEPLHGAALNALRAAGCAPVPAIRFP